MRKHWQVYGVRLEGSIVMFGADRSSAYTVDCHHLLTHWTTYELSTESKKCHMRSALCSFIVISTCCTLVRVDFALFIAILISVHQLGHVIW